MKYIRAAVLIIAAAILTGCSDSDNSSEPANRKVHKTDKNTSDALSAEMIRDFDADKYFKDNSEKVISVESAETYSGVITGSEAVKMMNDRGFTQTPLEYYFDTNGNYLGISEATEDTEVKAPLYKTSYVTENEIIWTVYVAGNSIIACPVSYNFGSEDESELILSESEQLVSYYDNDNKYYITIPKKSFARIVVVENIDAETLESYTKEALEKL